MSKNNKMAAAALEEMVKKDFKKGDLLVFDINSCPLLNVEHRVKDLHKGYPAESENIAVHKCILECRPFIFLEWAAYDKRWGDTGLLFSIGKKVGNPRYMFGMDILIVNKVMFLTCGYMYSLDFLINSPREPYFVNSVAPHVRKIQ